MGQNSARPVAQPFLVMAMESVQDCICRLMACAFLASDYLPRLTPLTARAIGLLLASISRLTACACQAVEYLPLLWQGALVAVVLWLAAILSPGSPSAIGTSATLTPPDILKVFNSPSAPPRSPITKFSAPAGGYSAAVKIPSLTRALGLRVNRIVIDAGHGGRDTGTIGPNGVTEKDVVLDVALQLSQLIRSELGAETVLTRPDDRFVPLRERTAMANAADGDLFLSIHANSAQSQAAAGAEAFVLSLTANAGSLDVVSRENAGSGRSVRELKTLVQSIALNDKLTESEALAATLLNPLSLTAETSGFAARNRGVRRAPFVVLIGATMPSVLVEIGFLSNPDEGANLRTAGYRRKIAESLFAGIAQYSESLGAREIATALSPESRW
jgi:N-acetylmuramoyl-L-alanine amidase